jgi:hypothetical protein
MKKFMLTFVAAMFFVIGATAYAIDRRTAGFVNLEGFDKIHIEANTRLKIITADTFAIRVDCPNAFEKRCLKYDVSDGTLNIKSDYPYGDENSKMFVTVITPKTNYKIEAGSNYSLMFRKRPESNK